MIASTQRRLADAIATVARAHAAELDAQRANAADARRPDFVWHYLLESYSTWGSVRGHVGLMKDPVNYASVAYDLLRGKPPSRRIPHIERVLRRAKVRMPHHKAVLLSRAVDVIAGLGGPQAASAALWAQKGAPAKLRFLKQFPGVGAKYARNIMMDVFDPDFRASIAVDARILRFAGDVGLVTDDLGALEIALLKVAEVAGLDGWTVDRVLFNWADEVRGLLHVPIADAGTVDEAELVAALVADVPGLDVHRPRLHAVVSRFSGRRIV